MKKFGFRVRVWGDMALFANPDIKDERRTYDVMTPMAAKGILESIYWTPQFKWVIDKIYVQNPISYLNMTTSGFKYPLYTMEDIFEAYYNGTPLVSSVENQERVLIKNKYLKNVSYVIEAHFTLVDKTVKPEKIYAIMHKRLRRGACYLDPYLGKSGCAAFFRNCTDDHIETAYEGKTIKLGKMLYDYDYTDKSNVQPIYYFPVMKNGMIDVRHTRKYKCKQS